MGNSTGMGSRVGPIRISTNPIGKQYGPNFRKLTPVTITGGHGYERLFLVQNDDLVDSKTMGYEGVMGT